jgi:high affinity Mn2+ porin
MALPSLAQQPETESPQTPDQDAPTTIFPHLDAWWWVSGQGNFIFQAHPEFPALYSGSNSLQARGQTAFSRVITLYTGARLSHTTEFLFDLEEAGGHGLSEALGLGGVTNVDVVRNPSLSKAPYLSRVMLVQVIPLSKERIEVERDPLHMFKELPVRRLEIRAGKFSMPDFFDVNSVGSDSHLQLMNWTLVNNGAYDYAADTRGYTFGVVVEYDDRAWSARFAEASMPTVANGPELDFAWRRARAENMELELLKSLLPRRSGTIRLLAFVNHAHMGSYREATAAFLDGTDPVPDITKHEHFGAVKYGFGVNLDQEVAPSVRVFGRFSWNEGQHESYAYTEVDQHFSFGAQVAGERWRRKFDRAGVAFVTNAISRDHQLYLRLGGQGFLLGDGNLTYGRENIVEGYYTLHLWRGIFAAFDLQHINNPGYNSDRGPVLVPGLRLHLEL